MFKLDIPEELNKLGVPKKALQEYLFPLENHEKVQYKRGCTILYNTIKKDVGNPHLKYGTFDFPSIVYVFGSMLPHDCRKKEIINKDIVELHYLVSTMMKSLNPLIKRQLNVSSIYEGYYKYLYKFKQDRDKLVAGRSESTEELLGFEFKYKGNYVKYERIKWLCGMISLIRDEIPEEKQKQFILDEINRLMCKITADCLFLNENGISIVDKHTKKIQAVTYSKKYITNIGVLIRMDYLLDGLLCASEKCSFIRKGYTNLPKITKIHDYYDDPKQLYFLQLRILMICYFFTNNPSLKVSADLFKEKLVPVGDYYKQEWLV